MQSCKHYGNLLCLWCPNLRFHDVSNAFTEFFATCEWRFPQTNEPASSCHFGEARSRPESAAWNPRSTVGRVLAVDGNGGPNIIMGDFPWFFIRIPMVAHDAMVLFWSQSLRTWDLQASAPSTTEARDGGCSWGTREVDQPDSPCCGAFSTWYECKSLGFRTCIAWRWMEIPYIYNLTTSTQNYGFLHVHMWLMFVQTCCVYDSSNMTQTGTKPLAWSIRANAWPPWTVPIPDGCAMLSAALIVCVVFPVAGKFTPDAGLKPGGSPRTSIWNVKQCETDLLCHIKQGSAINPWGVINLNPGLTAIWWFEPSNHHSSRAELCAQSSPHKAQLRSISKGLDRSLGLQILSSYGSNK